MFIDIIMTIGLTVAMIGLTVAMWVIFLVLFWVITKILRKTDNYAIHLFLSLTILFMCMRWIFVNFVI